MIDPNQVICYTAFRETLLDAVAEYARAQMDETQREAFLTWCRDKVTDSPLIAVLQHEECHVDQELKTFEQSVRSPDAPQQEALWTR